MSSTFRPISCLIEVDFEWREPHSEVLRHPIEYYPEFSRVIFHESVHYWQQIGQSFLTRMILEDWERLIKFEKDGTKSEVGPYRREFVRKDQKLGFSARDLQESLARFWDVHVLGPHNLLEIEFSDPRRAISEEFKKNYFELKTAGRIIHPKHAGYSDIAFDLAMSATAGNYAMPYQFIREHHNSIATGTMFPLVGHFAFQTERPIDMFRKLIEIVGITVSRFRTGVSINDMWKYCYNHIRWQALELAEKEYKNRRLMQSAEIIYNSILNNHPVYSWILNELTNGVQVLSESRFVEELLKYQFDVDLNQLPRNARGILGQDFCLACPGDPINRSFLLEWLSPPCILFPNNQKWILGELYRREIIPEISLQEELITKDRQKTSGSVLQIEERWSKFREFCRGY